MGCSAEWWSNEDQINHMSLNIFSFYIFGFSFQIFTFNHVVVKIVLKHYRKVIDFNVSHFKLVFLRN